MCDAATVFSSYVLHKNNTLFRTSYWSSGSYVEMSRGLSTYLIPAGTNKELWASYSNSTEVIIMVFLYITASKHFSILKICNYLTAQSSSLWLKTPSNRSCAIHYRWKTPAVTSLSEQLTEHAFNSALKCRKHSQSLLLKREQCNIHF